MRLSYSLVVRWVDHKKGDRTMAAHAVQILTEELTNVGRKMLGEHDLRQMEVMLNNSPGGNLISHECYRAWMKWIAEARSLINNYGSIDFDFQNTIKPIIWRELESLLREWVRLGEPRNYEEWIERYRQSELETKRYKYFVSLLGKGYGQLSVIDGIIESSEIVDSREKLEAIKILAKYQIRGIPDEVLAVINLVLIGEV